MVPLGVCELSGSEFASLIESASAAISKASSGAELSCCKFTEAEEALLPRLGSPAKYGCTDLIIRLHLVHYGVRYIEKYN